MASIRLRATTVARPALRGVVLYLLACSYAFGVFAVLAAPARAVRDVVAHDADAHDADAHDADALRDGLDDDENEALDTLALADAGLRDAVLDASLHPDVLSAVASIQEESSSAFRRRLDRESRTTQQDVWELSRYPELVDEIVLGGRPARGAIDDIIEPYPERVREIARGLALHHFEVVSDTALIREDAERESRRALEHLPLSTQASFEALLERPDMLSAMLREPRVVERVAQLTREDAWNARAVLDREHETQSAAREREIASWRETIENDSEARAELRESAERFAEDEGYDDPGKTTTERVEVHHYYHHPYPWWFGPPHWRVGLHWYPHRTHWGFHVAIGGTIVINDLPSPIFSYWHYRRPHSHTRRYHRLHDHWARFGPRHHLHRDYRHRMHSRGHHGVRRGHARHSTRPRHHTRARPKARHQRERETTNKFFRHDGARSRDTRSRPLHSVRRGERQTNSSGVRRVANRRDRRESRSKHEFKARGASESRRKFQRGKQTDRSDKQTQRRRITSRDSRSSRNEKIDTRSRSGTRKREGNRLTSSKRYASKSRTKVARRSKASTSKTTNKFMRPSTRTAKKSATKAKKQQSNRKLSSKSKHESSKRAKSRSKKSTTRKTTHKKSGKSSKGRSSNKFFARR